MRDLRAAVQLADVPAIAVVGAGAVGQLVRRERAAVQLAGLSSLPPATAASQRARSSTVDTSEPAAYGCVMLSGGPGRTTRRRLRVAGRARACAALVAFVGGVRHAERHEDALLDELGVGLARYLFDDRAEQEVAGVVVARSACPARTRSGSFLKLSIIWLTRQVAAPCCRMKSGLPV